MQAFRSGYSFHSRISFRHPKARRSPRNCRSRSAQISTISTRAEGNPTKDQMRLMMQSLLAERFKSKVNFETREASVFALTLVKPGKVGPGLRPHSAGPPCPESFIDPAPGAVVPKAANRFP